MSNFVKSRINAAREVINVAEYECDPSTLGDFPVSKTRKFTIFTIFEVFTPSRAPPWLLRVGSPDFKTPDFFELNLSDRAKTFRIDATGELINVADYEHDPSTLSDFFATKTSILNGFSLISTMYYQCCPGI